MEYAKSKRDSCDRVAALSSRSSSRIRRSGWSVAFRRRRYLHFYPSPGCASVRERTKRRGVPWANGRGALRSEADAGCTCPLAHCSTRVRPANPDLTTLPLSIVAAAHLITVRPKNFAYKLANARSHSRPAILRSFSFQPRTKNGIVEHRARSTLVQQWRISRTVAQPRDAERQFFFFRSFFHSPATNRRCASFDHDSLLVNCDSEIFAGYVQSNDDRERLKHIFEHPWIRTWRSHGRRHEDGKEWHCDRFALEICQPLSISSSLVSFFSLMKVSIVLFYWCNSDVIWKVWLLFLYIYIFFNGDKALDEIFVTSPGHSYLLFTCYGNAPLDLRSSLRSARLYGLSS